MARIAARELRIGLREGLLEEAIAAAFDAPQASVRRALMLLGEPVRRPPWPGGKLDEAALHRPTDPAHAGHAGRGRGRSMRRVGDEAWIEDKYDGIRAQLHFRDGGPACSAAT